MEYMQVYHVFCIRTFFSPRACVLPLTFIAIYIFVLEHAGRRLEFKILGYIRMISLPVQWALTYIAGKLG